jgi:succinyl-CoA:acetate CoA-transferase
LENKHLSKLDFPILEATYIDENGNITPTNSVGNSANFAHLAGKIIIEINTSIPLNFKGLHDVFLHKKYPNRDVINIKSSDDRIGVDYITIDPEKVVGIVFTEIPDSAALVSAPDKKITAIANHLLAFFENEIEVGRLTKSLMPLQVGIGKVANAVMSGFSRGNFENLVMYSEVLQDSTFELFDSGKMDFASA